MEDKLIKIKPAEQECLKRFEKFIIEEGSISDIFWVIDTVMANYSRYVIEDNELCGGSYIETSQLYYLKSLRDVFIQPEETT